AGDARVVDEVDADGADHEGDEENRQPAGHEHEDEQLLADERAVGDPVDDVERRLEHAEEAKRAPEERDAADDPDRRRLILNRTDDVDQAIDRARRKRAAELLDEVARLRLLACERGQRQREEEEGHEGEEGEVGDHRREVRSTVSEELGDDAMHAARSVGTGAVRPVVASPRMDAAQALPDLPEISAQIEAAVLADHDGSVVASTLADDGAAKSFAEA